MGYDTVKGRHEYRCIAIRGTKGIIAKSRFIGLAYLFVL